MEEVGFINVVEKKFKLPIGNWPADPRMKELGIWYRAYFEDGMEGYAMALLTRVLKVRSCQIFILISHGGGWLILLATVSGKCSKRKCSSPNLEQLSRIRVYMRIPTCKCLQP
jgi:hypothetical protein